MSPSGNGSPERLTCPRSQNGARNRIWILSAVFYSSILLLKQKPPRFRRQIIVGPMGKGDPEEGKGWAGLLRVKKQKPRRHGTLRERDDPDIHPDLVYCCLMKATFWTSLVH